MTPARGPGARPAGGDVMAERGAGECAGGRVMEGGKTMVVAVRFATDTPDASDMRLWSAPNGMAPLLIDRLQ